MDPDGHQRVQQDHDLHGHGHADRRLQQRHGHDGYLGARGAVEHVGPDQAGVSNNGLDRRLADKRVFPAVDVDASGTRKEELLMSGEELKIVWKLRRVLHALDQQQSIELLLSKLRETNSNNEFLLQVQKTAPAVSGTRDED